MQATPLPSKTPEQVQTQADNAFELELEKLLPRAAIKKVDPKVVELMRAAFMSGGHFMRDLILSSPTNETFAAIAEVYDGR